MPNVFVSYSHKDKDYPSYGSIGWVECFYKALRARLNQLRPESDVWRDESGGLSGASVLTPTISQALSSCGVLVIIVSPAYLSSEWCAKELRFFMDAAAKDGGLTIATEKRGYLSRVVKVVKVPVSLNAFQNVAPELADGIGHEFYQEDAKGTPIELAPPQEGYIGEEFSAAVNDLAWDIYYILDALDKGKGAKIAQGAAQATIYLAETTSDLDDSRRRLRQELEQFGCSVVPATQRFPGPEYATQVQQDLANARLSIHMVGDSYGMIPERASESIVEMQYRLAGEERARRPELTRMVWMPPGVEPAEDRQRTFVASLHDDPNLVVAPLEEFKTLVHDALKPKEEPKPEAAGDGVPKSVYLIFDMPDEQTTKALDDWLFERGFEVLKRTGETSSEKQLALHKEFLEASDGVLIYYGHTTSEWLQMNLIKLNKFFATSDKPKPPSAVVLADPKSPDKEGFRSHLVSVIPGFGGFAPDRLEGFVKDLEATPA